jgi:hypothetical protein
LRIFFNIARRWRQFLLEFIALNIPHYITHSRIVGQRVNIQLSYYPLDFFLTPYPRYVYGCRLLLYSCGNRGTIPNEKERMPFNPDPVLRFYIQLVGTRGRAVFF